MDSIPSNYAANQQRPLQLVVDNFGSLGRDFVRIAKRLERCVVKKERPTRPLLVELSQCNLHAGRLLEEAGRLGAFEGEAWWRNGLSWFHRFTMAQKSKNEKDKEFYLFLWKFAIRSWLSRRPNSQLPGDAAYWDFSNVAFDKKGRPLGRNSRPLTVEHRRNGKCVTARKQVSLAVGETYSVQLKGAMASETYFYSEWEWLDRLRARTSMYGKACAEIVAIVSERILAGPRRKTIVVSEDYMSVAVDGETVRLKSKADGEFVQLLHNSRGKAMKGADISDTLHRRPDRIYKRLPNEIRDLIKPPGRGQTGYLMP